MPRANLVPKTGGSRTRSSQFPEEWSPQGREAPPHESDLPPHPSQLLPGAGEAGSGRPGPRRTPGKGRKAGEDVVGRKKFWGFTGKQEGSLGGDSEGEELGVDRRPAEERDQG